MLEQLLTLASQQGRIDVPRLARRLGVSEMLVRQMLEDLQRLGYIQILPPPQHRCQTCPIRQRCQTIWQLTPKGRKFVERTHRLGSRDGLVVGSLQCKITSENEAGLCRLIHHESTNCN